jgi:hypothetical protein
MTALICFAVPCAIILAMLVIGELFGKKKTWNF